MALPPIVTEAMQTSIDANRRAAEQSQAFSDQVRNFSSGIGELSAASMALNQFAKRDKKFKNPFKSIKESFDKTSFGQARIQKREEEQLASKIGITREELLLLKAQKELTDSQEQVAESFRANAAEYGINLEGISTSFNDVGQMLLQNGEEEAASLEETLGANNISLLNEMRLAREAIAAGSSEEELAEMLAAFRANQAELAAQNEEVNANGDLLIGTLQENFNDLIQSNEEQQASSEEATTFLQRMARGLSGNNLAGIENAREQGRRDEVTAGIFEDIRDNLSSMEKALIEGFGDLLDVAAEKASKGIGLGLGLLLAPIALAAGMLSGLTHSLKQLARTAKLFTRIAIVKPLQALGRTFVKIGNAIAPRKMEAAAKAISNFTTNTAAFFKRLSTPLKNASKAFKAGLNGLRVFRTATGQFGRLGFFGTIGKGINKVKTFLTPVVEFFKSIGSKVKTAFSGVGRIGKFLGGIGEAMKPILKIASSIGRVIGKVFFPITVLMSAFDGVMGFIEGFKANGIIGGISGAFFGIIDGLVMKVLDLIKDLVSWVAEKLGFAGISEALDSFSFSEIWQGIGDKVQEFISYIKNFFGNLISSGISGIKKLFGFGGDEDTAEQEKNKKRAARLHQKNKNAASGRNSQEEKDADSLNLGELLKFNGADASDGAEVNARSQSAAGAANVITVVAPQTANVNNTSQSMNQTVSIPATANPNKARGRSGRRNRQYS
jgi:hypothetical protein